MAAPALTPAYDTSDTSNTSDGTADSVTFAPGTPLKEHAWALYCQGAHSPEIGRRLGISERTVRSWLSRTLRDLDAEHQEMRAHELTLAIARKRQLSAGAWESYSRLSAIADAECVKAANGDPTADVRLARQALSTGARYLALANAIDRDLVRLTAPHKQNAARTTSNLAPISLTRPGIGDETPIYRPLATSERALGERSERSPTLDATLLDLLTPEVIDRMAADGILDDDWPPALATDEDQAGQGAHEHENAGAAKTANPEDTALAASQENDVRIAHSAPIAPTPKARQFDSAATSAISAMRSGSPACVYCLPDVPAETGCEHTV